MLDEYQVGRDRTAGDEEKTRRISRTGESATPSGSDAVAEQQPAVVPTTRAISKLAFWRSDGSAANDAEVIARIMVRKQERRDDGAAAAGRVENEYANDRRKAAWLRQQQEIQDHLQLEASRRQPAAETPLQRALREAADIFLALGICPDHLEYLPDIDRFCSWGGMVYEHSQVFAMRDPRGAPLYTFGSSPQGESAACYSPRERRWGLPLPVSPADPLRPVDRLLPVPRRHPDGSLRWSAQRPGALQMDEGMVPVYVVGTAVYTVSQLIAAHHRHSGTSPLLSTLADQAQAVRKLSSELAQQSNQALDRAASTIGEHVMDVVGGATDTISSAIASTTRFFRRKKP